MGMFALERTYERRFRFCNAGKPALGRVYKIFVQVGRRVARAAATYKRESNDQRFANSAVGDKCELPLDFRALCCVETVLRKHTETMRQTTGRPRSSSQKRHNYSRSAGT